MQGLRRGDQIECKVPILYEDTGRIRLRLLFSDGLVSNDQLYTIVQSPILAAVHPATIESGVDHAVTLQGAQMQQRQKNDPTRTRKVRRVAPPSPPAPAPVLAPAAIPAAPAVAAQAASVDGLEHDSRQPSSNGSGLVRFPPAVTREKETRNPTIRRKHPRD